MIPVFVVSSLIAALAVIIHYEFLYQSTRWMPRMALPHRLRIVAGVLAALLAHTAEVILFGVAFYLMEQGAAWGHLQGNFAGSLADCIYFSLTSYTTLGTGDIEPLGDIRFLSGLESLTGLVLITWTA